MDLAGEPARLFYRRRIVKIFPNHVLTWTAGLILMIAGILGLLIGLFILATESRKRDPVVDDRDRYR